MLQRNHRFRPLLSFRAAMPLQPFPLSPLFVRHTHAQTPTLQPLNPWLSHFITLRPPHLVKLPQSPHFATFSSFKRFYRCSINKYGRNYPELAAYFRVAGHIRGTQTPALLLDTTQGVIMVLCDLIVDLILAPTRVSKCLNGSASSYWRIMLV